MRTGDQMKRSTKKLLVLLVAAVVLGISLTIPLMISECNWNKFWQSRDILAALSSFITLIIALLLYNRFGIEESVLERRNNAVISLLEAMKKLRLVLDGDAGIFAFNVNGRQFDLLEANNLGGKTLLFNYLYLGEMKEIYNAVEDLLMPPKVHAAFDPLVFHFFNVVKPDQIVSSEYLLIDPVAFTTTESHGTFNNQTITLSQYISYWKAVIQVSNEWLHDNSSIKIDLNI